MAVQVREFAYPKEPASLRASGAPHVKRTRSSGVASKGSEKYRELFADAYAYGALEVPNVRRVRVIDQTHQLDVYTCYVGDIREIEEELYDVEASALDRYPDVRVDWHFVALDDSQGSHEESLESVEALET